MRQFFVDVLKYEVKVSVRQNYSLDAMEIFLSELFCHDASLKQNP